MIRLLLGLVLGLAWHAAAGAETVTMTGSRETRRFEEVFGPGLELVAVEQPVLVRSPAGQELYGCIMALFEPERRVFWWAYQATADTDGLEGGRLILWLRLGSVYADGKRIARFLVPGRHVWMRESTEVVDSIEQGLQRAASAVDAAAPELFSAGAWYMWYDEVPLTPALNEQTRQFFLLPMHAQALPDPAITGIDRTRGAWELTLRGYNPDLPNAWLQLRHDGTVTGFTAHRSPE